MAQYGEWNRKGATLSDVTAKAEYGVSQDLIVKGIQAGKLEYRDGSVWGNPPPPLTPPPALRAGGGGYSVGGGNVFSC